MKLPVRKEAGSFDYTSEAFNYIVVDANRSIISKAMPEDLADELIKRINGYEELVAVLRLCDWYLDKDESHPVAWLTLVTKVKDTLKKLGEM